MTAPGSAYICRYCRQQSDFTPGAGAPKSCPHCGAPVEVRGAISRSGWEKQPPITDMARIQFGESSVQIEGKFVPTADFRLGGPERIYFSHHSVLWAEPSVQISTMPMAGGWNRMRAGLPLVMLGGPGHIALSEDAPGEIVALPLQHGQSAMVREHRFLAATSNVAYAWESSNVWITTGSGAGTDQETHFPLGAFVDVFSAQGAPGLLLLHSPGNTFIRDLTAGETICIQPSSLLYKDLGVGMQLHIEYPNSGGVQFGFGSRFSYRNLWLRMWGPGRVAVQSVFDRSEESGVITGCSPATTVAW